MKGYKAFNKGLVCRGKQYAENTVFEEEQAEICKSGMHFCEKPLDVLDYYPLVNDNGEMSEFAEVEALDEVKTEGNKSVTKKLRIGGKITFSQLVQASIGFDYESVVEESKVKTTSKKNAKIGSSGDSAKIGSSGDSAKIGSSGYSAKIGSSGDYAQIGSSGYYAKIGSSGDSAKIGSSGDYAQIGSTGKNAVVMCAGNESVAKAKIGSWITLAEWKKVNGVYTPVCVKTEQVDGERIKEDTFYKLENGNFIEA